eukprot:4436891-Pleurochrysis_carterae.AAC.1
MSASRRRQRCSSNACSSSVGSRCSELAVMELRRVGLRTNEDVTGSSPALTVRSGPLNEQLLFLPARSPQLADEMSNRATGVEGTDRQT